MDPCMRRYARTDYRPTAKDGAARMRKTRHTAGQRVLEF